MHPWEVIISGPVQRHTVTLLSRPKDVTVTRDICTTEPRENVLKIWYSQAEEESQIQIIQDVL